MSKAWPESAQLLTYPMHGQSKLLQEGYRTRDGHYIEWFGRLLGSDSTCVVSRAEPAYLKRPASRVKSRMAAGTVAIDTSSWVVPDLRDRRQWWVRSAGMYPEIPEGLARTPAVIWNPFVALARVGSNPLARGRTTVFDLLDDWTIHEGFQTIRAEVYAAYRAAFETSTYVTANAEGTLALAHRFGRTDAKLIPNGCDPDRFSVESRAAGPLTVGYVGKIGFRVDLELIQKAANALPGVTFVFAGPILDAPYRPALKAMPNVVLLGDVHYEDVPALLETFDVGWVPHRVGRGEVGGDVIKTYEYRAAGLPVLSTPIAGAESRGLDGVTVLRREGHVAWLENLRTLGPRVPRELAEMPAGVTWEEKAMSILSRLRGLEDE